MIYEDWLFVHIVIASDGTTYEYAYNPMFDGEKEDFIFNKACRVIIRFREDNPFKRPYLRIPSGMIIKTKING